MWDLVEDVGELDQQRQQQEGKTKWVSTEIAKPHSGSIWRLSWAHPEFGQVSHFVCCAAMYLALFNTEEDEG